MTAPDDPTYDFSIGSTSPLIYRSHPTLSASEDFSIALLVRKGGMTSAFLSGSKYL
jgi:hypothetical protein